MFSAKKEPPTQFILYSQPRSGCHLLERMLSRQSGFHTYLHHPFGSGGRYPREWLMREPLAKIPQDLRSKHDVQMEKGVKVWREKLAATKREGKGLYVHFHPSYALSPEAVSEYLASGSTKNGNVPSNPLDIPDDLALQKGTIPVFTIRNPRLQVPSAWRVLEQNFIGRTPRRGVIAFIAGRWTRLLFDWYVAQGVSPLVVDADDLMTNEAFVRYLCQVTGLNPAEMVVKWESVEKDPLKPKTTEVNYAGIHKTLLASQGPEAQRAAKNVDLEAEEKAWEKEFGESDAGMLKSVVKELWPD